MPIGFLNQLLRFSIGLPSGLFQPLRGVSRPKGFLDLRKIQSLSVHHIFLLGSQLLTSEDVMVGTET
jgi:hypothetical protein